MENRQIKNIQDDVNDYIDNSQEPDFIENEFIYDDIQGLEEMLLDVSFYIFLVAQLHLYLRYVCLYVTQNSRLHFPSSLFGWYC